MKIFKCKKLIVTTSLIAMFLATAHQPLPAKERRGSTVEVTMTDGNIVKGELLYVRDDALLVFEGDSGRSWYIYLEQMSQVKVLKKSKLSEGVSIGLGIGLLIGVNNLRKIDRESLMPVFFQRVVSFFPLPIAGLCGGLLGALAGIPKKISLAGASPEIIQQNLRRLKRYARE